MFSTFLEIFHNTSLFGLNDLTNRKIAALNLLNVWLCSHELFNLYFNKYCCLIKNVTFSYSLLIFITGKARLNADGNMFFRAFIVFIPLSFHILSRFLLFLLKTLNLLLFLAVKLRSFQHRCHLSKYVRTTAVWLKLKTKLRGLSPRANNIGLATSACRQS
jgi:hypothetical protein